MICLAARARTVMEHRCICFSWGSKATVRSTGTRGEGGGLGEKMASHTVFKPFLSRQPHKIVLSPQRSMTVSEDDDAQQIERDKKLALVLQCEENIQFAVSQRHEAVAESDVAEREVTSASAEALLHKQEEYTASCERDGEDRHFEMFSSSFVARETSLEAAECSDGSFVVVSEEDEKSSTSSSPLLVSDVENKSSDEEKISSDISSSLFVSDARSSDISSSYTWAAVASAGRDEDDEHCEQGIGMVPSVSLLREAMTNDASPIPTTSVRLKGTRQLYFFDIRRPDGGDVVFQAMLGEYGDIDPLLLNLKPPNRSAISIESLARDPTALSLAAIHASLGESTTDPKLLLEQYC